MKIDFLNGKVISLDPWHLEQLLLFHEDEESIFNQIELAFIDVGLVPLQIGWPCECVAEKAQ